MKKRRNIILLLCGLLLVLIALFSIWSWYRSTRITGFFLGADAYYAVPQNTSETISLTFYYQNNDEGVSTTNYITFPGTEWSETVTIDEFSIFEMDEYAGYNRICIQFSLTFTQTGTYRTDCVELHFPDGSYTTYPIGSWIFEAGPECNLLLYNEIISSSDKDAFRYSFNSEQFSTNSKITEIMYGENKVLQSIDGFPLEGNFTIADETPYSLRIICPRLVVEQDGTEMIAYSTTHYAGTIGESEDGIEQARLLAEEERSKLKQAQ